MVLFVPVLLGVMRDAAKDPARMALESDSRGMVLLPFWDAVVG